MEKIEIFEVDTAEQLQQIIDYYYKRYPLQGYCTTLDKQFINANGKHVVQFSRLNSCG